MRRFLSPRWLAMHVLAVCALCACLFLAWWQLTRAQGGNTLSWGYTFEWPVFGVFAIAFWIKLIRDERRRSNPTTAAADEAVRPRITAPVLAGAPRVPARRTTGDRVESSVTDSPTDNAGDELAEYNRYLAWRNANPDRGRADYPG